MADLGNTFDSNDIPADDRSFDPLPAGDYLCQIVESELVDLKSGKGQGLKLTLEVMDGPRANRKIWSQLNIRHENATAQSIAQRALADICQAVGVGAIRDSDELHFRPLIARVGIQKDNPERNEVKRYKPAGGTPPAAKSAPTRSAAPPPQQRTAPAGNRPWAR